MNDLQKYVAEKMAKIHKTEIVPGENGDIIIYSINSRGKRELCYVVHPTGKIELLFEKVLTKKLNRSSI